ncbi:hypothetical protein [Meiothermus taiwanensis]|jgi:hypothetical protein|uniref:Lipoprotein n=2 Tax=Meiothermus taiwanensis TaxID=172827 RepID=A0A399DXG5_9DEIN|nr:hypothetical protein [Meiothermus taiwanensis]AWR85635.1 hypothetical protein Mtai_v1c03860 [Meiothermus taiwanensis WR-220]KIQ53723.1 hypothetical protein SY28_12430 [Meiothermus taiwanensis]RIH76934.1 hypothetical protein Mcate_01572 [Meiothermus taiwanensis]
MKPLAWIFVGLLVAVLGACGSTTGPNPSNPNPGNPSNPNPGTPNPGATGFKTAAVLPEGLKNLEQELSPLLVELVELARSKSQNAATLTGTLTQSGNTFTYSSTPTDRLRVVWSDGVVYEFVITQFQGNLAGGATAFYKGNHLLQYSAQLKPDNEMGPVNLSLRSQRQGSTLSVSLGGTAVFDGQTHTLNLNYAQQVLSDFGPGSILFHHQDTLQGSLQGPSFQIQVNETYDFRLVGSDSLVMQTIRTLNNAWSEGGQQFRLQNGLIKRVFRDGNPIELDFWTAEGDLLRGNTRVGGFGQALTGNLLEQFLDTPSGRVRLGVFRF